MPRGWRLLGAIVLTLIVILPAASAGAAGSRTTDAGVGVDAHAAGHDASVARQAAAPGIPNPLAGVLTLPDAAADLGASLTPSWLPASASLDASASSQRVEPAAASEAVAPAGPAAGDAGSALAAAGVLLTLGGILWALWGALSAMLGRGAAAVVPLFSRIPREEVLENATRADVYRIVKAEPGICTSEVARHVGVSWGTVTYHLHVLESNHYVTSLREGRHRRFFENGGRYRDRKEVLAVLRNATTRDVLRTIRAEPGLPQKEVARRVDLSPQALHWHLARLQEQDLLRKERDGRVVRHFAAEAPAAAPAP